MHSSEQIKRYNKLIDLITIKFNESISVKEVENITNYSYRNMNRIFTSLNKESIGKYIKRIRIEKAAENLKYTNNAIGDIAFKIGFNDLAVFNKAFKNKFGVSPSKFRNKANIQIISTAKKLNNESNLVQQKIDYKIELLPDFNILYIEHKGSYGDIKKITLTWSKLLNYAKKLAIIDDNSIFLAEILDDNHITDDLNCRYSAAIIIPESFTKIQNNLFRTKTIKSQKYIKFTHQGSHEKSHETYNLIFPFIFLNLKLELLDLPILEFYLNDEDNTPKEELLTEIYIPIK
ncbi:hypothetical protein CW731_14060 [Polaribacter sp. ALD11]|uniref:AraC family transcriptional regulator n=1 Tax=Polaribacter sp. ALD11 TaxID=2058137 RepID=UPI000C30F794|nr:GyrI-like domain-containing protein [Polaribacter sp. ALD11]AUC86331.1 hypothetical protein CW731_14060 [Polaribacter sp. ALD11]